ncbi:ventrally expressed dharma/bozozok antagonist isoform X3 [Phycodurus eques]|uniref:ventrally expressed dharma/bozozok antagonist isoform X3 n=1 Tax=Phycodurus eques TaxID=693459 RepID=UPI002ACDD843|nr:ventrally expressed dharma/bozozok antagonist isoform X3 [Phycodurus eques]
MKASKFPQVGLFSSSWRGRWEPAGEVSSPSSGEQKVSARIPESCDGGGHICSSLPGVRPTFGEERPNDDTAPPRPSSAQGKGQHFNISKNGNLQTSFGPLDASEADFSSGAEEETSGYESERSLSPPPAARDAAAGRRPRTAFTAEQIGSLERAFKRNAYLGTRDKAELCEKLRLSDKQIRNWFQNRRMKLKRTAQDALAHAWQASAASHFAHYPAELRAYRPAAYGRYRSPASPPRDASAAAFARPPHDVQYASVALPLDSLFQYGAAPPPPLPLAGSYPAYPPYY